MNDPGSARKDMLQQALLKLKEMKRRLEAAERATSEPVAIVGMGCRFPGGAGDPERYWSNLLEGVDAVTEIPPNRWNIKEWYDPDPSVPGKTYCRHGGFVDEVDQFDPGFFGIAPRDAVSMDPQHRFLLEVAYEALERAGQAPDRLVGTKTGVFVGITANDYSNLTSSLGEDALDAYTLTGSPLNFAAGRLAYVLGLQGPTMSVDTACSSSLVSVHLACAALRLKECDLALAGGVNLILTPHNHIILSKAQILSPTGRCRTFDAAADGIVRSEGCGMLVLKRLSDALSARDPIVAVIRASSVNQDGTSGGLTVPNKQAQDALIRDALKRAELNPLDIGYIEAHGTGTPLGDPIEIRALHSALCRTRSKEKPLIVGSAKANMGHAESAAGVAGLVKAALMVERGEIPPHLHLRKLNPHIDWSEIPIEVPRSRKPWTERTRRAGVSSFGASGTNAHIIVENPPARPSLERPLERPMHLLSLSARTPKALKQLAGRYAAFLDAHPDVDLGDLCMTANSGRSAFRHRLVLPLTDAGRAAEALRDFVQNGAHPHITEGQAVDQLEPRVAFLFTGQGAQYAGMGKQLYETQPVFREMMDRCAAILEPELDRPLFDVLFEERTGGDALIHQTAYAQPCLCALEVSLAALWRSWGIEPEIVIGHSVGEYAAAIVAGVFSLGDGLKLIAARGRLMQALSRDGEMAAIDADPALVEAALEPYEKEVSIAAVNGPSAVVISGRREAVRAISGELEQKGARVKALTVSHAFHSPLMDPMLKDFEAVAQRVTYSSPTLDLVSNLTGRLSQDKVTTPAYWVEHIRAPVRFAEGIHTLIAQGANFCIEVGPHPVLLGMGMTNAPDADVLWIPSLRRDKDAWPVLLESLGRLVLKGVPIDWDAFDAPYQRTKIVLPTYPFQHRRCWNEAVGLPHPAGSRSKGAVDAGHPLLGTRMRLPMSREIRFEAEWSAERPGFLEHHRLFGGVVVPGASHVALALLGSKEAFASEACILEELVFMQALVIPENDSRRVQWIVQPGKEGEATWQIFSLDEDGDENNPDDWTQHAEGRLRHGPQKPGPLPPRIDLDEIRARCPESFSGKDFYRVLWDAGYTLGSAFTWIGDAWGNENESIARMDVPPLPDNLSDYQLYPGLIDSCFQMMATYWKFNGRDLDNDIFMIPFNIGAITFYGKPASTQELWCHATFKKVDNQDGTSIGGDLTLMDETGRVIARIERFQARRVTKDALLKGLQQDLGEWMYEIAWNSRAIDESSTDGQTRKGEGSWLIFADEAGLGETLAKALSEEGERAVLVRRSDTYRRVDENTFEIDPNRLEDYRTLLKEALSEEQPPCRGVYHLWSMDMREPGRDGDVSSPLSEQKLGAGTVLNLVQALVTARQSLPRGIRIVTRGTQAVVEERDVRSVAESTLWGLGRVIALEHPELGVVLIDLDPNASDASKHARHLADERWTLDGESLVAWRGDKRCVARLVRHGSRKAKAGTLEIPKAEAYRLKIPRRGILDHLYLGEVEREAPGEGEVEIGVRAIGVNFRDVLGALDLYPGDPGPFGGECAGVITRVGPGVRDFKAGDAVVAALGSKGCFGNYAVVPAAYTQPKPESMSFAEAVSLPATAMTALHGLRNLAHLKAGEKVLIHAAAGGVGMAAVQIAQAIGAEVFGTAGKPEKRALLREMGVQHVYGSRDLNFKDEIEAAIGPDQIDVVLNSLGTEFIDASLELLKPGGRFVEIGKADVWDDERVKNYKKPFTYYHFDLAAMAAEDPETTSALLRDTFAEVAEGRLKALPIQTFPMTKTIDAFRFMAAARHVGKVVVTVAQDDTHAIRIRDDRTYLITGGLGALGRLMAQWLVDKGARHIALMGRRAPGPEAQATIESLREAGADVQVLQGDVSRPEDVEAAIGALDAIPLGGVVHAAGVLDDGVLLQQSWPRFEKVMAPKVDGAWYLHRATQDMGLDLFILFSSASSLLGSPGQSNYAASNAFLDALAHYRHGQGLNALSVNWGPWADGGMADTVGQRTQAQWNQGGMGTIKPAQGLQILEEALEWGGAQLGALPVKWSALLSQMAMGRTPPYLSEVAPGAAGASAGSLQADSDLIRELRSLPPADRPAAMLRFLQTQTARVLGLEGPEEVGVDQPLREMGLDSLMGVELRNAMSQAVGRTLPVTMVFDYPTLRQIGEHLLNEVLTLGDVAVEAEESPAPRIERAGDEAIAVIGMACRVPGGITTPDEYWELLADGLSSITEVPSNRWDIDAYYDPDPTAPGKMYTRYGSFLDDIEYFDPGFFGIKQTEAIYLDPQHRLFLEVSWEALENARIVPESLLGSRTGVFMGICTNDYRDRLKQATTREEMNLYAGTGNLNSAAAGRISYFYGLQGPCVSIDTACSTSLVTIHEACKSLRMGECDLALAGGVSVILSPDASIYFSRLRVLSPDGRCKTFDASADGYVRSEGCGIIVLKPLSAAQRDGDRILAVVRGSAVNQDGRSNGLTAPNGRAQKAVIEQALRQGGVKPEQVGYVEAHGTGTALGDPIEVGALTEVFGASHSKEKPLIVGAVKTNIGHAEGAAGILGVLKTILALRHARIPRNLHFNEPSPFIDWEHTPVKVPTEAMAWPEIDGTRIGGISSFGISGTNAHVILEQAPRGERVPEGPDDARPLHVLTLSGRVAGALRDMAGEYARYVEDNPSIALSDLAYTLNVRRTHLAHRAAVLATSVDDALEAFNALAEGGEAAPPTRGIHRGIVRRSRKRPQVGMAVGETLVGPNTARDLYRTIPLVAEVIREADTWCAEHLKTSLIGALYPESESQSRYTSPSIARAATIAVGVALIRLWQSWGIAIQAVSGASGVGRILAAYAAGVLDLDDALTLAAFPEEGTEEERRALLMRMDLSTPALALFSGADGRDLRDQVTTASFWLDDDASSFTREGLTGLRAAECTHILSIGLPEELNEADDVLPLLDAGGSSELWPRLGDVLGRLFVEGASLDWSSIDGVYNARAIDLPTYAFQRKRYWVD